MIIPFAIPRNGEVINLSQIVRLTVMENGTIDVAFANGEVRSYSGEAAEIVNKEVHFAVNIYRQMQIGTQSAIVGPDGAPPVGRIM